MAVMMHDMKKVYWGNNGMATLPENKHLRLRFDVDPLSCVITLADVLQDFERPCAGGLRSQAEDPGVPESVPDSTFESLR